MVIKVMQQQQNNVAKVYSKSLKNIIAMKFVRGAHEDRKFQVLKTQREASSQQKGDNLRISLNQLLQNKRKYEHQIDQIVHQYVQKEKLQVELPALMRKNSYHNYRIQTSRHQELDKPINEEDEDEEWKKQELPRLSKEKRTKTQAKEYALSHQRDGLYSIVKHFRLKSLKEMQLNLDVNQLKKWHEHNRKIAQKRQVQGYKIKKMLFH